jgi:hypothetical protein
MADRSEPKGVSMAAVIKAAKELNETFGLDGSSETNKPIETKSGTKKVILAQEVVEVFNELAQDGDHFTDDTLKTIEILKGDIATEEQPEVEKKKTTKPAKAIKEKNPVTSILYNILSSQKKEFSKEEIAGKIYKTYKNNGGENKEAAIKSFTSTVFPVLEIFNIITEKEKGVFCRNDN